jgi:hypothetical protein
MYVLSSKADVPCMCLLAARPRSFSGATNAASDQLIVGPGIGKRFSASLKPDASHIRANPNGRFLIRLSESLFLAPQSDSKGLGEKRPNPGCFWWFSHRRRRKNFWRRKNFYHHYGHQPGLLPTRINPVGWSQGDRGRGRLAGGEKRKAKQKRKAGSGRLAAKYEVLSTQKKRVHKTLRW